MKDVFMPDIETSNKEPKKEKNIKHGVLAISSIVVALILIIIGIYFYGQHPASKQDLKPVTPDQTTASQSS
jgi:uncharacterized membrane protein YvbJ